METTRTLKKGGDSACRHEQTAQSENPATASQSSSENIFHRVIGSLPSDRHEAFRMALHP